MLWATQRQVVAIDFNNEHAALTPEQVVEWVQLAINSWGGYTNDTHLVNVSPVVVRRKIIEVIES